jgi:hypothetical protein
MGDMRGMKLTAVLIFVLVFSACGGSSPDDSVEALCRATCERKDRCGTLPPGQTKDACFNACKTEGDKVAKNYRPGFLSDLTSCEPGLACDQSDDLCLNQAMAGLNPNWTTDPELQACVQQAKTCNAGGAGFSDDYCAGLIFLTADTANVVRQCLTLACGSVRACLLTIME